MRVLQVLSERSKRQERRQQLLGVRSQGNFLWRALHEGALRANYLFTDHTRNALILAVFGFRVSPANPECHVWASTQSGCQLPAAVFLGELTRIHRPLLVRCACNSACFSFQCDKDMTCDDLMSLSLCSCWSGGTRQQRRSWQLSRSWSHPRLRPHHCPPRRGSPCPRTPPSAHSADRLHPVART